MLDDLTRRIAKSVREAMELSLSHAGKELVRKLLDHIEALEDENSLLVNNIGQLYQDSICVPPFDFSGYKVGDKAWHITLGMCFLSHIEMDEDRPYAWSSRLWDANVWTQGDGRLHSNDTLPTIWPSKPVIKMGQEQPAVIDEVERLMGVLQRTRENSWTHEEMARQLLAAGLTFGKEAATEKEIKDYTESELEALANDLQANGAQVSFAREGEQMPTCLWCGHSLVWWPDLIDGEMETTSGKMGCADLECPLMPCSGPMDSKAEAISAWKQAG